MAVDDIPVELTRLWRLPGRPRVGRPPELDVEVVVRTAVDLADRDGVAGVSMAKIARLLGVTGMALYTHVGSKHQLLTLMQDLATGTPPAYDTRGGRRAGLTAWAKAQRRVCAAHPWLSDLPIQGAPLGPHRAAWMEAGLQILDAAELDWGERLGTIGLLGGYVLQASRLSTDLAAGRRTQGIDQARAERDYADTLSRLIDREGFPQLTAMLSSGLFEHPSHPSDDPAENPDFLFGLERVLDGIEELFSGKVRPGR